LFIKPLPPNPEIIINVAPTTGIRETIPGNFAPLGMKKAPPIIKKIPKNPKIDLYLTSLIFESKRKTREPKRNSQALDIGLK
jgi:hypothetical protein